MNPVAAIALLALRQTLRSRVVLALLALLLTAAFLLPLAIRHDGTPEGLIRLQLTYSLGIAGFLLSLVTLWAGCAAISKEADDNTLQLVLVKPVPRLHVWLGKWSALLVLNALLLALAGGAAAAGLHAQLRRGGFDPAALDRARLTALAALDTIHSPLPDIEADVRADFESWRARNGIPPGVREDALLDSLRRARLARLYSIPPGESNTWTFPPPPSLPAHWFVQFRCDASVPGAARMEATLDLDGFGAPVSRDFLVTPGVQQMLLFTNPPAPDTASSAAPLAVTFRNHGTHGATLFFEPGDGLVLRHPHGTFAANYLRALLLMFLRLALFAAVGVTLGTLFSMPVAAFLGLVLMLVLQLSGFIRAAAQTDRQTFVANVAAFGQAGHAHDGDSADSPAPSLAARALANTFYYAYRGTWLALRPLLDYRAPDDLAAAARIPPRDVARALLQQGLLLPAFLALLSTAVLNKREWALPQVN